MDKQVSIGFRSQVEAVFIGEPFYVALNYRSVAGSLIVIVTSAVLGRRI